MLTKISELTEAFDERYRQYHYYYELVDSEFGTVRHKLTDPSWAFARIVIIEYSQRRLNVAYNLKILFSNYAIDRSYDELIQMLDSHNENISGHYGYNMNFGEYYNCLKRHIDRLRFVGKVK